MPGIEDQVEITGQFAAEVVDVGDQLVEDTLHPVEVLIRRHCDRAGIVIPEQSDLFPGNDNG